MHYIDQKFDKTKSKNYCISTLPNQKRLSAKQVKHSVHSVLFLYLAQCICSSLTNIFIGIMQGFIKGDN